jgi:aspartate/methionine/tyrosine aminotransferase
MRCIHKIQDTAPTHTSMLGQRLASYCLEHNEKIRLMDEQARTWVDMKVRGLSEVREKIWEILEPLGTFKTNGAFYFLVPMPSKVSRIT